MGHYQPNRLFPKEDALKVIQKMYDLTEPNGTLFVATTVHDTDSEGFEEEHDYSDAPVRYRKHWPALTMQRM